MLLVPPRRFVLGSLFLAGLAVSLVGVSVARVVALRDSHEDPCAIAMDTASLGTHDRGLVARHMLACSDLTHGRITAAEYRAQIAAIDKAWTPAPAAAPIATQWASAVREVSSQYSATSWSAAKVLGPPDVFPASGDNVNAWASLGADDREEVLEVAYAQPMRASAVEIYETYNPGAVRAITLVTTSGARIPAYQAAPMATGMAANRLRVETACTTEPIAAVRVELGSMQVAGWNEIDAIGLVPCAE